MIAERADRLHFAGLIGQIQLAPLDSLLVTQLLQFASERFHLDAPALEKFLEPLHKRIEEFATLLHVNITRANRRPLLLAGASGPASPGSPPRPPWKTFGSTKKKISPTTCTVAARKSWNACPASRN